MIDFILNKVGSILVGHDTSSRIKCVCSGIIEQIRYIRGVDVCESEQSSREVSRVVISPKHTAKLSVEHCLNFVPGTDTTTPTMRQREKQRHKRYL